MGLAEPRKRIKIAHDPRNTTWTDSTDSYGRRLMQQQGWQAGEALGAKGRGSKYGDAEAARVNVKYKDDMLGLGATLKSKDIANQKTGFDAFQGLLGRLNAKTTEEVQVVEKKLEDKKLAMFAQGRWGGMLFVPGGILVQSDPYKLVEAMKAANKQEDAAAEPKDTVETSADEVDEKARRKVEKKQRKEEKRLRKEAKRLKKESKTQSSKDEELGLPTPDSSSANETDVAKSQKSKKDKKSKKREHSSDSESEAVETKPATKSIMAVVQPSRNGRHLLRGKNIQAKRMAFSDMKGLDEIFMKAG